MEPWLPLDGDNIMLSDNSSRNLDGVPSSVREHYKPGNLSCQILPDYIYIIISS